MEYMNENINEYIDKIITKNSCGGDRIMASKRSLTRPDNPSNLVGTLGHSKIGNIVNELTKAVVIIKNNYQIATGRLLPLEKIRDVGNKFYHNNKELCSTSQLYKLFNTVLITQDGKDTFINTNSNNNRWDRTIMSLATIIIAFRKFSNKDCELAIKYAEELLARYKTNKTLDIIDKN